MRDYCNSVLHRVSAANVYPLQNVLNAAARIILRKRKFDRITTDAPTYLTELCSPVSESANRGHLRPAARGDLVVPRSGTTTYGQRCFAVSDPVELSPIVITDTDSALCAFEDCDIL